ncbi:MAG: SH3 domain-containing protein [Rhodoferax sp.]|uniref:SH3 domain-containing protein n=1 Tax=Rhodoferax sp. TaxID=50421 RepID=UPI0013FF6116|nr:SH3 domain-containing protein [Rhodoferax sp.]NDP40747.1 SH3 domain-containing protein [Rhodoferax sp.]
MFSLKYLFTLLVALISLVFAPALQARDMVSVAKSEINMRTGASTRHSVVWALSTGYPLEVTARKGKWLKVRDFEKDTGWVYRPLVNKKPHVIVKSSVANVRSTPSTGGRILGKAPYGEVLRTLEHRNNWVKVQRDGGLKGWIAKRLVWGW